MVKRKHVEYKAGEIIDIVKIEPNGMMAVHHQLLQQLDVGKGGWGVVYAANSPHKILIKGLGEGVDDDEN